MTQTDLTESSRAVPGGRVAVVRRRGNMLDISPTGSSPVDDAMLEVLDPVLKYTHREYQYGSADAPGSRVQLETRFLYGFDAAGRLRTPFGFGGRVVEALKAAGYTIRYADLGPPRSPKAYCWERDLVTERFSFRPRQEDCLEAILAKQCGIINAITGFGKMALIAMVCLAAPHARIHVVTRRVAIVERLTDYLAKYFVVGRVGGGVNDPGERVTIYTADSLHKSPADADILLVDEAHELVAESFVKQLRRYQRSRNFAFTASPEGRFDGADVRLEGLFGRQIFKLSYPEGVSLGLVVPITVLWADPPCTVTCSSTHDMVRKKTLVWTNDVRNDCLARAALQRGSGLQKLFLVETIEHAVHLKDFLPRETRLMYASMDEQDLKRYQRKNRLPSDFQLLNRKSRNALRLDFEQGNIETVVATGSWAVGVSFDHLGLLVRMDAGASSIYSIQGPGRVSRVAEGKSRGLVLDSKDSWNDRLYNRHRSRRSDYLSMEWEEEDV